jgi:hypothetical protein
VRLTLADLAREYPGHSPTGTGNIAGSLGASDAAPLATTPTTELVLQSRELEVSLELA